MVLVEGGDLPAELPRSKGHCQDYLWIFSKDLSPCQHNSHHQRHNEESDYIYYFVKSSQRTCGLRDIIIPISPVKTCELRGGP